MMAVAGTMVFAGAMALALGVIWFSIAPQWRRIAQLATGHVEQRFQPLEALALAEHRIAVRRWAAPADFGPALTPVRLRAAA